LYIGYSGFDSKPFKSKDPNDFCRNANPNIACADRLDGIQERLALILLAGGEARIGKIYALRRRMVEADDIRLVLLNNTTLGFPALLNYRLPI
jgi:hypothetical protein